MIVKNLNAKDLVINELELSARLSSPILSDAVSDELYGEAVSAIKPSYAAIRVKLLRENGGIRIGKSHSRSKALLKLFEGCSECFVFAATLGVGADRLVLKKGYKSVGDAFVIDALFDALIEAVCDAAEADLTDGVCASGRVRPGYGDIELSLGAQILALCDAERTLGIKLTESGLMVPKKSVSAIIAIKDNKNEEDNRKN